MRGSQVEPAARGSTRGGARSGALFASITIVVGLVCAGPASAALLAAGPTLRLERTIRTRPFVGSSVSMRDGEGSAYVRRDGSLWLADDNGRSIYEVDPKSGELKRVIRRDAFETARRFGGGKLAGPDRVRDLESLAYDAGSDTLYAFSGSCCSASVLPTAFRLKRTNGVFRVESYQPLPKGTNFTAAGWSPSDRKLYAGTGTRLWRYRYARNAIGPRFRIVNVSGITGLGFSRTGSSLYVVTDRERLLRVDWGRRRLRWSLDLRRHGIRDARAVERIGARFFVLDGYDGRANDDPRKYAVFVLVTS